MNTAGWLLTENGRQPWIVQGLMQTKDGVSPSVSTTEIVDQPRGVLRRLYIALGVVDVVLMLRYARRGLELEQPTTTPPTRRRARRPGAHLLGSDVMSLPDAVVRRRSPFFWTGFFVLEGFDFGVGVLHTRRRPRRTTSGGSRSTHRPVLGRQRGVADRRRGAAMFAAFPGWYATWFSAFYLAVLLLLVALIVRGVSFEFRGKVDATAMAAHLELALTVGRLLAPLLLGVGARRPAGRAAHRRRRRVHRHLLGPAHRRTASGPA